MTEREKLEKEQIEIRKKINELDEKDFEENGSLKFNEAIGKCYGVNELKGKNQEYLTYFKHLDRIDDRTFDVIKVEIRAESGKIYNQSLERTTEFYYSEKHIGSIYQEISDKEFQKYYNQVKRKVLLN